MSDSTSPIPATSSPKKDPVEQLHAPATTTTPGQTEDAPSLATEPTTSSTTTNTTSSSQQQQLPPTSIGADRDPDASIYISEIDQTVNEADLFDIFSAYGNILSIRVAKDPLSRASLGYAYVNYTFPQDAAAALAYDFALIHNKPCRVSAFQKDPTRRKAPPKTAVYIRNLEPSVSVEELKTRFAPYGPIVAAKVAPVPARFDPSDLAHDANNNDTQSSPQYVFSYGCVEYETPEQALAAIKAENGTPFGSRTIYTSHHVSRRNTDRPPRQPHHHHHHHHNHNHHNFHNNDNIPDDYTNLLVKNIDPSAPDQEFLDLFAQHGEIASHTLPIDPKTGTRKGFGFVAFKTHDAAANAQQALNLSQFYGAELTVSPAQQHHPHHHNYRRSDDSLRRNSPGPSTGSPSPAPFTTPTNNTTNLYIKYLDIAIDDAELRRLFAPHGTISSARVMLDESGQSRGFGFVCYTSPAEAQTAIAEMHGAEVSGKSLYVTIAQRRDKHPGGLLRGHRGVSRNNNANPLYIQQPQQQPHQHQQQQQQHHHHHHSHQQAAFTAAPFFSPYYLAAAAAAAAGMPAPPPPPPPGSAPGGAQGSMIYTPYGAAGYPAMMALGTQLPPPQAFRKPVGAGNRSSGPGSSNAGPGDKKYNGNGRYYGNSPGNGNGIPASSNAGARQQGSVASGGTSPVAGSPNVHLPAAATSSASASSTAVPASTTLSAALASAANPEAERQVIGEALYPKVQRHVAVRNDSELAAKLTGMMLDIAAEELLRWIDDDAVLAAQIQEAYDQYMEFLKNKDDDAE